jgi:hypothetical protein
METIQKILDTYAGRVTNLKSLTKLEAEVAKLKGCLCAVASLTREWVIISYSMVDGKVGRRRSGRRLLH